MTENLLTMKKMNEEGKDVLLNTKDINKLEKVQKRATKLIPKLLTCNVENLERPTGL